MTTLSNNDFGPDRTGPFVRNTLRNLALAALVSCAVAQQKIADTFFALKLIPKPIKVSDAVALPKP